MEEQPQGIQDSIEAISLYLLSKGATSVEIFDDQSVLVRNDDDPENNEVFNGPEEFTVAVLGEIAL